MNVPRYVIAGSASLVIHAALLFVAQESKVFAMPAGSQSQTVSINFTPKAAPSIAQEKSTTKPEPVSEKVAETLPQKNEPQPVEAPSPPQPKAAAAKPVPTKKTAPIANKKPTVKENKVKKKTVKEKQPVAKQSNAPRNKTVEPAVKPQPQHKPQTQKIADKKVEQTTQDSLDQPQEVNQGLSNQDPVLITKPSFSAQPTPPKYPRKARRRGIEGVATYEIWLDENGQQIKQALVSSSGALMLDAAALNAIQQWKFSPHKVNGRAIAHRVQVPVRFRLD